MKKVNFGFSLGDSNGLNAWNYKAVVEYVINHGCNHFRFYEPFIKGLDMVDLVNKVKFLTWYGKATVMICVSNIPFEWLSEFDLKTLTKEQLPATEYTNRFNLKPAQLEAYEIRLLGLIEMLKHANVLQYVSFEVANEPDASRYFYGGVAEMIEMNSFKARVLATSGRPVYVGGFTSEVFRDASYKNKQAYMNYINTTDIFKICNLSHHFYWIDGSGIAFDLEKNSYPDVAKFKEIAITEYNVFTSIKAGSEKETVFNSIVTVRYLCDFLKFIYDKPVTHVYHHSLCDYKAGDGRGIMGLYIGKMPKPAAIRFFKVMDVIRNGYDVLPNGIKGLTQSIIIDGDNYTVVANKK